MDLTDSTHQKPEPARSALVIDLNEVPSSLSSETLPPDAFAVVRTYHNRQARPAGAPVGVPGDLCGSECGASCGRTDIGGDVVVCDGCERWFHLDCAGMQGFQAVVLDEWMCEDCVSSRVPSKRWPLGSKSMPASKPKELQDLRKHTPGENSFGASVTYTKSYVENGFGFQKASGIVTHTVTLSFEDILHHIKTIGGDFEKLDTHSISERCKSSKNTSKMYLQALREFIAERHGILGEGWHVELKTSMGSGELHAVYCAPDGKTFESMPEVACYLGLMFSSNSIEPEVTSIESASLQRSPLRKRQKSGRLPVDSEDNGTLMRGSHEDISSDSHNMGCASGLGNNVNVMEARLEESNVTASQGLNDGLPVQYEDFFITSLGKVDTRPSYHNVNQIWPIGYKSCWHDKVTGSVFMCDVSEGGDSGPTFRVRRCSCAELPIPIASTTIFRPNFGQSDCQNKITSDETISLNMGSDGECSVQMLLSDPSPPRECDILSCLGSGSSESFNARASDRLQPEATPMCQSYGNISSDDSVLSDEIGEFYVEGSSPSSAWEMVSKKLIDKCREICMRRGTLKFFCKHVEHGTCSSYCNVLDEKSGEIYSSLAKFCGSSPSVSIPFVIQGNSMLETVSEVLVKWLDQDRFGLDVEFVQEFLEQLPDVLVCSNYVFSNEREFFSSSLVVRNGLLLVKTKNGLPAEGEETLDGLSSGCIRDRTQIVEDPVAENHCPPSGKPISLRLPRQLVGDVFQVYECLWRFRDILGLREVLSFEELEKDLLSPWSDGLDLLETFEREFHESKDMTSTRKACTSEHLVSLNGASHQAMPLECPLEFIPVETRVMKEAAKARIASVTYSRCTGFTLTKAHYALLKVLISELQSKVAAVVDPSSDTGEPKSKRGRKKDTDCSTAAKRTKLNMLPINEFTWPELARRLILAFLSMDGNLESAEITSRESRKVFRCLQGDGGVLCGSLTGVAGMEADALLLAEAAGRIFHSLKRENDFLALDDEGSDATSACERATVSNANNIPEWALLLEPVRKLPTNVGARIRKCVNEALVKGPPEWAKKILEHSISKEVYKGNASGPTKKAVLSVLADVCGESLQLKSERGRKRKKYICISDMIMRHCRIVLRRAAAADVAKVFCNLLGRKLIDCSDNDDEGILGSPAMVSRPLDFRTIDLRLAAGSYGGHESFLEDVRELWTNIRIAYAKQPDLIQLAETLSHNFESMYEKEVLNPFLKFLKHSKSECLSAKLQKEINDYLVSASELPKAPWEEGVCKICGIDKDDFSVLLCDSCDGEYHKYCLNPPLARIPKGNWYCPSCVAGKHMVSAVLEHTLICRVNKKYEVEVTRGFFGALTHLAAAMEEREYWELSVDERTFLLNFLCDELLNSALTRQHLEHCGEGCGNLQQKLRSLSAELKSLKQKEVVLASKLVIDRNFDDVVRDGVEKSSGNTGTTEHVDLQDQSEEVHAVVDDNKLPGNLSVHMASLEDQQCLQLDMGITHMGECVPPTVLNESQANSLALNSVKNEISLLQGSITSIESELVNLSLRREFLGSDSAGRLYWVLAKAGARPWVVVSGNAAPCGNLEESCLVLGNSAPYCSDTVLTPGFSGTSYHSLPGHSEANSSWSSWVSYESETEIKELVGYLKDNDPKERELKESILLWQKLGFHDTLQTGNLDNDESRMVFSNFITTGNSVSSTSLITKASSLLEKMFGPCSEPETYEVLKKRVKKAKEIGEEKMYRCECLEPVWPSRHHCLSCHRTFVTYLELDRHVDAKCNLGSTVSEKSKENSASKGKGMIITETVQYPRTGEMDVAVETSKSGCSELSSRLIKSYSDGLVCPLDFGNICSRFKKENSNKQLVEEIGLIGSNGIPSFVPSVSPYLSDSTRMLIRPQRDVIIAGDGDKADEAVIVSQGKKVPTNAGLDNISGHCPSANEHCEQLRGENPALGLLEEKDKKPSVHGRALMTEVADCCIIPECSLRPVVGKASQIFRRLKINLLDMEAALPEAALRPSKAHLERRWAWRAFVKSAETIYEMVQAMIVFEDMIKAGCLMNTWWYWSSLTSAAKISTLSSLALRIYSLDAAIDYERNSFNFDPLDTSNKPDQKPQPGSDAKEKSRLRRKPNKKRKELEN